MDLIQSGLLLFLLKLSPLFILTGEVLFFSALGEDVKLPQSAPDPPDIPAVYECSTRMSTSQTVKSKSARLTKGCELNGYDITFFLSDMYVKTSDTKPVEIDISEANFIDSQIKLIDAKNIPEDKKQIPFLFTIHKITMSGTSQVIFGDKDEVQKEPFKLPPKSRLRILNSKLTISSKDGQFGIINFFSLQLVSSSIEIAHNVITAEVTSHKTVFFLPVGSDVKITEGSTFTLKSNEIHLNVHGVFTDDFKLHTRIWCQAPNTHLTISDKSQYTWELNNISMLGYSLGGVTQYVWHLSGNSSLTIAQSNYKWLFNNITVVGYNIRTVLFQSILRNHDDSLLKITDNSSYILAENIMSTNGYDVTGALFQYVWMAISVVSISKAVQFIIDHNKMLMTASNYGSIQSSVMLISAATGEVSGGSSMILRRNCVGMGQKETDKRYVFTGKWSISDKSVLLLDGNYFTTTSEYKPGVGSEMTKFIWGPTEATDVAISTGTLTIRDTEVYANSGATGIMVWKGSLFTSKASVKQPTMDWSSSPAKDGSGALIPTLDNGNVGKYMCIRSLSKDTSESSTAFTYTAVLISSVVFLYFFI